MTLRAHLTAALAGTTSQKPIATETLAKGHSLRSVEAALMEMYQDRQVMCCKLFKRNDAPIVKWWTTGKLPPTPSEQIGEYKKTEWRYGSCRR